MSKNIIPHKYDDLMSLSAECITGATNVGPGIPLVLNTATVITDARTALASTQAAYKGEAAEMKELYEDYHEALKGAFDWCQKTRDYLRQYLGNSFNQGWVEAGFHNSVGVERDDAFLSTLLGSLQAFFLGKPSWEDVPHEITAAMAGQLLGTLTTARGNVNTGKLACSASKAMRDAAFTALRVCLRSLCDELKAKIGNYDSRWLAFGLNVPGASSTPEVPQNVAVNNAIPGQFQITCDAVPNATRYRFFLQRPIIDPKPVLAGSSTEPLLVVTGLVPGQSYQVYVSAVNEGDESLLSAPVQVQVQAQAA